MPKEKEMDWNEGIIDYMPEDKQNLVLKKFERAVIKAKQTPEGRRRLAKAFGKKASDFK